MQRYLELPVRGDKENDPAMPVRLWPGPRASLGSSRCTSTAVRYAVCVRAYVRTCNEYENLLSSYAYMYGYR